jgi:hypothetical protein
MDLNTLFALIRADLASDGHDMRSFATACLKVEQHLAAVYGVRAHDLAQQFQLTPADDSMSAEQAYYRLPAGVVPPPLPAEAEGGGLVAARARAF